MLDSKSITSYGVIMEIYKSMKSEFNQLSFRVRLILIVHKRSIVNITSVYNEKMESNKIYAYRFIKRNWSQIIKISA